jgi:RNA polymerase sigma factor (sigma-70 family)
MARRVGPSQYHHNPPAPVKYFVGSVSGYGCRASFLIFAGQVKDGQGGPDEGGMTDRSTPGVIPMPLLKSAADRIIRKIAAGLFDRVKATPDDGFNRALARIYARRQASQLVRRNRSNLPAAGPLSAEWAARLEPDAARLRDDLAFAALAAAACGASPNAALQQLWERLRPRVRAVVRGFARGLDRSRGLTPDDLMQEAFVKLQSALPRYDARKGSFPAWYETALRRYFIQLQRHGKTTTVVTATDAGPMAPEHWTDPAGGADTDVEGREVGAAVRAVFRRLVDDGWPHLSVDAFRARHLGEKTLQAVADELGRSVPWVHKAVLATRAAFADRLRRDYPSLAGTGV